jgi:Translation initiation factor eIF3 subunit 135
MENVPTDSTSLEVFFHNHGVNMRYLGAAITQLEATKEAKLHLHTGPFKHIKSMFERDIFLRSLKHVFNRVLRDECGGTDLLLSNVVCHLLNCVLAPTAMVQALNSDDLKFEDDTV